jgi:hypothetical protein
MGDQQTAETTDDTEFKLLSVASLLKRIHNNITLEDLHIDAERKFDTLVDLLNDTYRDETVLEKFGYSMEELKQVSHLIFNRLISEQQNNPFQTLCVREGATMTEIKRRRNILLHIFHPDRNNVQESSASKTSKINDAFDKISTLYSEPNMPLNANQTNIPPSYPYMHHDKRKSPQTTILITVIVFIVLGIMIKLFLY